MHTTLLYLLRSEKLAGIKGENAVSAQIDMSKIYLHRAADIVNRAGKEALYAFAQGDELKVMLMGLKRFTKIDPFNLKEARRRVADVLIDEGKYVF
jgi:hypothetical protein